MAASAGRRALEHIDQQLAEQPKKNGHVLSQATLCLSEFRDQLVAEWRANGIGPDKRTRLEHVNAVITIVLGIHFPLGDIPWAELDKARGWLAEIVDADEPVS